MTNITSRVLEIISNHGKDREKVDKNMTFLNSIFEKFNGEPLMVRYDTNNYSYFWIIGKINTMSKSMSLNEKHYVVSGSTNSMKSLEFPVEKSINDRGRDFTSLCPFFRGCISTITRKKIEHSQSS